MKKYSLILILLVMTLSLGCIVHAIRDSHSADTRKEKEALSTVFPEAKAFSQKMGSPPHYKAYLGNSPTDDPKLIGLAFVTTDDTPDIRGYAGAIKMMVGMDLKGSITRVEMISHTETPSYVVGITRFLEQFRSLGIQDSFKLGENLDGMTRATVTSDAITQAIEKSLKTVAQEILGLQTAGILKEKRPLAIDQIMIPFVLFAIAIFGVLYQSRGLRWVSLLGGLIYFGIIKSTMVSVVQIANIFLLKFPPFQQSPLWYSLFGLTLVTTLLMGMVYCGSLCPFASIQEVLFNVFKKLRLKRFTPTPERPHLLMGDGRRSGRDSAPRNPAERGAADFSPRGSTAKDTTGQGRPAGNPLAPTYPLSQGANYIKYGVLLITVALSLFIGKASAAGVEPYITLFTQNASYLQWTFLLFILIVAIFHFRFWCRYLCPVGACLGLIALMSPFKIRLGHDCLGCNVCERACPTWALKRNKQRLPVIDYPECILCGKCIQKCPNASLSMCRSALKS